MDPDAPAAEPSHAPSFVSRFAALVSFGLAGGAGLITATMGAENIAWVPGWTAATLLYVVGAMGLWKEKPWARPYALGLGLFGLAGWTQATIVVGVEALTVSAVAGHAVQVLAALAIPTMLPRRHTFALVSAAAALSPAVGFAFAPDRTLGVTLAVLAGVSVLVGGAIGVARGRTWGVLLMLVGAPALAVSVMYAPELGWLAAEHPILPRNPVMMDVLGTLAAMCGMLAITPYLVPMGRFLFARGD